MAKAKKMVNEVETSPVTAEPMRDSAGRLLDGWGLPVNGLQRATVLAALGLPDPHDDPADWEGRDPAGIAAMAEAALTTVAEPAKEEMTDVG